MSYAYTPGLKVKTETIVRKSRRLPIPGEVLASEGDHVQYDTVVARTFLPGDALFFPVFHRLGVMASELPKVMLKEEGDKVTEGEVIAVSKSFFGMFKTEYAAEMSGVIEMISSVTGMVCIRGDPRPVNLDAYISGRVIETEPKQGVTIETVATFIQGIFGIGGEKQGEIKVIAEPDVVLSADMITDDCAGKVLVGGALISNDVLQKAESVQAKGVITGGIDREDLTRYIGYEIGVAITGSEDVNLTCIITEGFGQNTMAPRTYELFKNVEGHLASIDGSTQIRAGVIRPEIIVPVSTLPDSQPTTSSEESYVNGIYPGTQVRIIRQPYYGAIGTVHALPVELQKLESESYVRVMEVNLGSQIVTIPRANAEIIEE